MKLNEIKKEKTRTIEGFIKVPRDVFRLQYDNTIVKGNFHCNDTLINSLVGSPIEITGDFSCMDTDVGSLVGGPQKVGGIYICSHTEISSLKGIASSVGNIICDNTHIESLSGIHKQIRQMTQPGSTIEIGAKINDSILGVMMIKGLVRLLYDPNINYNKDLLKATQIINNCIRLKQSIHIAQEQLIESGLERFAKI